MNTPTVGNTIHFTDNPAGGGGHARCFKAEVINANPDGTIDVREFLPNAESKAYAIREGKPGELYTWHCCHRQDPHEHTTDGGSRPVNTVHGSVALPTARKLRAAAAALRADASDQCGPLRDALQAEAEGIEQRAAAIEEQAAPVVRNILRDLKSAVREFFNPRSAHNDEADVDADTAARTKYIREHRLPEGDEWKWR